MTWRGALAPNSAADFERSEQRLQPRPAVRERAGDFQRRAAQPRDEQGRDRLRDMRLGGVSAFPADARAFCARKLMTFSALLIAP
jgi:hypothetical protein